MAGRRVARLNEQLKRELMELLQLEVRDPRVGPVTITAVEATADLYHARIYVTSLGTNEEKETTLEGLRAASPYLRTELGRRLRVRRIPELTWEIDHTLERATRIERLLGEVLPPPTPKDTAAPSDDEDGGR